MAKLGTPYLAHSIVAIIDPNLLHWYPAIRIWGTSRVILLTIASHLAGTPASHMPAHFLFQLKSVGIICILIDKIHPTTFLVIILLCRLQVSLYMPSYIAIDIYRSSKKTPDIACWKVLTNSRIQLNTVVAILHTITKRARIAKYTYNYKLWAFFFSLGRTLHAKKREKELILWVAYLLREMLQLIWKNVVPVSHFLSPAIMALVGW